MASNRQTAMISLPSPDSNAATQWAFLEEGLSRIMNDPDQKVSYPKYMSLYTASYNYCLSLKTGEELKTSKVQNARSMGHSLYEHVVCFFEAHLNTLETASESLQGEALLQHYAKEWDRYMAGAHYVNRVIAHLNKHWVKLEVDGGRRGVYYVYTLALIQWRTHFLPHIQSHGLKLTDATLRFIERHRNGQEIDQGLVKKVVDSFVSLGINEAGLQKVTLNVYQEHFEIPFLGATEKCYEIKSEAFLAKNPILNYIKKVEEWLKEEEDRVERYLDESTKKPLHEFWEFMNLL